MNFTDRKVQCAGKRKLIKVDSNNVPIANEPEILVNILKDEGSIINEGTLINAEALNKGNWRDDKSLSFTKLDNDTLPNAKANETQIVTKQNGETWLVPPASGGYMLNYIVEEKFTPGGGTGTSAWINAFYKKWKDGTVEQWFELVGTSTATNIIFTLPFPMPSTSYVGSVCFGGTSANSTGAAVNMSQLWDRQTTTVGIRASGTDTKLIYLIGK